MPTYEYMCEKCNIVYEDTVSHPDKMKKTIKCSECGRRIHNSFISAPMLQGGTIPEEGTGVSSSKYYKDMQKAATDMRVGYSKQKENCDNLEGVSPYSNMQIDVGKLVEQGRARRATPEEKKNKEKNIQLAKESILPLTRRQYKDKDGDK